MDLEHNNQKILSILIIINIFLFGRGVMSSATPIHVFCNNIGLVGTNNIHSSNWRYL